MIKRGLESLVSGVKNVSGSVGDGLRKYGAIGAIAGATALGLGSKAEAATITLEMQTPDTVIVGETYTANLRFISYEQDSPDDPTDAQIRNFQWDLSLSSPNISILDAYFVGDTQDTSQVLLGDAFYSTQSGADNLDRMNPFANTISDSVSDDYHAFRSVDFGEPEQFTSDMVGNILGSYDFTVSDVGTYSIIATNLFAEGINGADYFKDHTKWNLQIRDPNQFTAVSEIPVPGALFGGLALLATAGLGNYVGRKGRNKQA